VARDTVIVLATYCRPDGPWIESLWGTRFSESVQTSCGTHTTSFTMDSGSLTLG